MAEGADRQVLVVAHARILRALLSEGVVEGRNPGAGFLNPIFMANAQAIKAKLEGSKVLLI